MDPYIQWDRWPQYSDQRGSPTGRPCCFDRPRTRLGLPTAQPLGAQGPDLAGQGRVRRRLSRPRHNPTGDSPEDQTGGGHPRLSPHGNRSANRSHRTGRPRGWCPLPGRRLEVGRPGRERPGRHADRPPRLLGAQDAVRTDRDGRFVHGARADPKPWREGDTGGSVEETTHPGERPSRLEEGTPNVLSAVGLAARVRVGPIPRGHGDPRHLVGLLEPVARWADNSRR